MAERRGALLLVMLTLAGVAARAAPAAPSGSELAQQISDGVFPVVGATILLHLASDSAGRQETGRRLAEAAVLSTAATLVLKEVVPSARPAPYTGESDGFPSGHTAVAFALATALSKRESGAGWVAYPLAAATAWSRAATRRHDWGQILAGAALGVAVGHLAAEGKLRLCGRSDSETSLATGVAAGWRTRF